MASLKKQKLDIPYRLGLDLGTNSIGWSIVALNEEGSPNKIIRLGSRIFSDGRDPKTKTSLAAARRLGRSMRRRRDRQLNRKRNLMAILISFNLMPSDEKARKALEQNDPYELRARAISSPLMPFELGRALFHLNQRRGFKSNRRSRNKEEETKISADILGLKDGIEATNSKTLGDYLFKKHQRKESLRARPGSKLYPTRNLYEQEFALIHKMQAPHQKISQVQWQEIHQCIFFQMELRAAVVGPCQIFPKEFRCPMALPSFQKFRLLQDINNLRVMGTKGASPLEQTFRDTIFAKLNRQGTSKFEAIRRLCKIDKDAYFNLESEKRVLLKGNAAGALLSKPEYFGEKWDAFSDEKQDELAEKIIFEENDEIVRNQVMSSAELTPTQVDNIVALTEDDFPKGYARFSQKALLKLIPHLKKGLGYAESVEAIGEHHSQRAPGPDQLANELPYYGEALPRTIGFHPLTGNSIEKKFGKIGNPTVHIALNQMRRVVNAVIADYGKPCEVVVEMARDLKLSQKAKSDIDKEQAKNQKRNEAIAKRLEELGVTNNYDNRTKFKLWEELNFSDPNDRRCVFSGERISIEKLFSSNVEIEHILPFSRTLDDGFGNKTLATTSANRQKGGRGPFEAFGHSTGEFAYDEILQRAQSLPFGKRRKFSEDAMKRFDDDTDGLKGFLARHLNDTSYLSKVAKQYVSLVCASKNVWVTPGRVTAMVRHQLGLNKILSADGIKNRADHRHHAIDALVVALMDRKSLQKLANKNSRGKREEIEILPDWPSFRKEVEGAVNEIVVSHRPEHGENAKFHEDTYYGFVDPPIVRDGTPFNLVTRKDFSGLKISDIEKIRDEKLREEVNAIAEKANKSEGEFEKLLAQFSTERNIRRVRLLKTDQSVREIRHPQPSPRHVKGIIPGDIHHLEFWLLPKGAELREPAKTEYISFKKNPRLVVRGVSFFDLKRVQKTHAKPHPAAKLKMKIHKGDLARINQSGKERIVRIKSLRPSNKVILFEDHYQSGEQGTSSAKGNTATFANLEAISFTLLFVDPIGNIIESRKS